MKMDNYASSGMMPLIENTNLSYVFDAELGGKVYRALITPFSSILYMPRGINVIVRHVAFCVHCQSHSMSPRSIAHYCNG